MRRQEDTEENAKFSADVTDKIGIKEAEDSAGHRSTQAEETVGEEEANGNRVERDNGRIAEHGRAEMEMYQVEEVSKDDRTADGSITAGIRRLEEVQAGTILVVIATTITDRLMVKTAI